MPGTEKPYRIVNLDTDATEPVQAVAVLNPDHCVACCVCPTTKPVQDCRCRCRCGHSAQRGAFGVSFADLQIERRSRKGKTWPSRPGRKKRGRR